MAHGIQENDRGVVGFTEVYGGTWHQLPQYEQVNGKVEFDKAMSVLDYPVSKVPLKLHIDPQSGIDMKFDSQITNMYALVRTDTGNPLYTISVSEDYEIFSNADFLNEIKTGLLDNNPDLDIESAGSIFGGRIAFVNFLMNKFTVKNDVSETVNRLMYYNAFGGKAITGCAHSTRIVCNNTLSIAESQGLANDTLKKFRHTKGVVQKVAAHIVSLSKMYQLLEEKKAAMDFMVDKPMNESDVVCFLGNIIPLPKLNEKNIKTVVGRMNRQQKIRDLWDKLPDLQGKIKHTRYAMLQAVTNYSQYETGNKDTDTSSTWWQVATGSGDRNELNQKAFDILSMPEIPVPVLEGAGFPASEL
jgi:phage/plasmid-like protein (TIGR03299 family)